MKKLQLLIFIIIIFWINACGTNIQDNKSKTYDMWNYMTPPHSIDVEYDEYTDGQKTDYFHETTKVFNESVERESGEEITKLIAYESHIRVEESNGNIITVQRHIQIGDSNIFSSSSSTQSCRAEDYLRSIIIKGYEFFNVLKVVCRDNKSSISDIYYGYDEGIIAIDRVEQDKRLEIIKVYERRLQ
jgi:hypothetical protein